MTELVGCQGTVTVATRGAEGPGEVIVPIAGGTETYLAYSDQPIQKGAPVVVYSDCGARRVRIAPLS